MEGALSIPNARSGARARRASSLVIMGITAAIILGVAFVANQSNASTTDDPGGVTPVTLNGTASGAAPVVGQPAPDFSGQTVDGKAIQLSQLRGHPVWLTFGASWCQPCRAENPDIQATFDKMRASGVQVIQVYMGEDASAVSDYSNRVGLTYTRVPDPDERLANQYRILGIPTHYFIDAEGVLRQMKIGSLDPAAMEQAVKGIGG